MCACVGEGRIFIIERSEMMIRKSYNGYNRKEDNHMLEKIMMLIIAKKDYDQAIKEFENDDEAYNEE